MRHSGWVLACHGCNRSIGEKILKGVSEVKASKNDHDWLGRGSYFWENSYHRALESATFLQKIRAILKNLSGIRMWWELLLTLETVLT
jgi:hypothetical protein